MNAALVGKAEKGKLVNKSNRYAIYIDEDGKTAPIPGGYCVVNNYTRNGVEDVNKIDNGLVISSVEGDDLNNTKQGNQFVWVPVSENEFATVIGERDGKKAGQLYEFTSTAANPISINSSNYREPMVIKEDNYSGVGFYDFNGSYYSDILGFTVFNEFETELQKIFDSMAESIYKYKGFYIGRFETGNLESNKYNIPVVQKGNSKISNVNWYYQYQTSRNISNENNNITTNMIWGCQWDRTLRWIVETNSTDKSNLDYTIVTNSTDWGNSGSKKETGSSIEYQKNHIYDLSGNVREWTIEWNNNNGEHYRGLRGTSNSASSRYNGGGGDGYASGSINVGSRATLYINL